MTRSSTNRTAFLILGSLATMTGVVLGIGGGALVWAHNTQRDSAGYYATSAERLDTPTSAMNSESIDFGVDASEYRWIPGGPTSVRLQATTTGSAPVFIGIARSAEVERYLATTAHAEVTDFEVDPFRAEMRTAGGSGRPAPPVNQGFWAVSANGTGTQTVSWPVQSGDWTVVVMNADGSLGVAVDLAVGANTGALQPIGLGMAGVALAAFLGGIALVVAGSGGRGRPAAPSTGPARPVDTMPEPAKVS